MHALPSGARIFSDQCTLIWGSKLHRSNDIGLNQANDAIGFIYRNGESVSFSDYFIFFDWCPKQIVRNK